MSNKKNTVLDLFCGCGGLSYGFIDAGYNVVLGIDHWKDAITTFENNHKEAIGLVADLFNETPQQIAQKNWNYKSRFNYRRSTMSRVFNCRQTNCR